VISASSRLSAFQLGCRAYGAVDVRTKWGFVGPMKAANIRRFGWGAKTSLLALLIIATALAPLRAAQATTTESYVWNNVAIYGGGYVSGIICNLPSPASFICAPTSAAPTGGTARRADGGRCSTGSPGATRI